MIAVALVTLATAVGSMTAVGGATATSGSADHPVATKPDAQPEPQIIGGGRRRRPMASRPSTCSELKGHASENCQHDAPTQMAQPRPPTGDVGGVNTVYNRGYGG